MTYYDADEDLWLCRIHPDAPIKFKFKNEYGLQRHAQINMKGIESPSEYLYAQVDNYVGGRMTIFQMHSINVTLSLPSMPPE